MVVDDDTDTRDALSALLRSYSYLVFPAANAREALLAVDQHRPACVLMDIGLPDIDGYGLARQLRALHGWDLVLIAVTGRSLRADHELAEAAGVDFVLVKPVSPDTLQRFLPPLD
ncbi:MAG: response regulator [Casimicrobiaceae bacterium]